MATALLIVLLAAGSTATTVGASHGDRCSGLLDEARCKFEDLTYCVEPVVDEAVRDLKCKIGSVLRTYPEGRLVPPDTGGDEGFGEALAVDGDRAVVGAWADGPHGTSSGSAYVFERVAGQWILDTELVPDDGQPMDKFGRAVDLSGDTVVVAAPANRRTDRAYVFEHGPDGWDQTAEIVQQGASSVALDDGILVVQDEVYQRSSGWQHQTDLGVDADAVDVDGDTVVFGRTDALHRNEFAAGEVVVYSRSGGSWSHDATLVGTGVTEHRYLGWDVAVDGDTVAAGAPHDFIDDDRPGEVYVFEKQDGTWSQAARLTAHDGHDGDKFGDAVDVDGDRIVVGAEHSDQLYRNQGSAYLFVRSSGAWIEKTQFQDIDRYEGYRLGQDVAVDGPTILTGTEGTAELGHAAVFRDVGP